MVRYIMYIIRRLYTKDLNAGDAVDPLAMGGHVDVDPGRLGHGALEAVRDDADEDVAHDERPAAVALAGVGLRVAEARAELALAEVAEHAAALALHHG